MSQVEKVELQGRLFALILRNGLSCEGARFFTPAENPIQLGILQHKQGTEVGAHVHMESTRTVRGVQEVLHIEYGTVEVAFYSNDGMKVGTRILTVGDTILLLEGGHGFKMIEDAKIVEVKQGPYRGIEEDKRCLDPM
jgi:hypothetical protein